MSPSQNKGATPTEQPSPSSKHLANGLLDMQHMPPHIKQLSEQNTTNSPLLRLPGELRNQIWDHVFSNFSIHYAPSYFHHSLSPPCSVPVPSTLHLVSRLLYNETIPFLYARPTFGFQELSYFKTWAGLRCEWQLSAVQSVRFFARDACNGKVGSVGNVECISGKLPGLKTLVVVRCCGPHVGYVQDDWVLKGVEIRVDERW